MDNSSNKKQNVRIKAELFIDGNQSEIPFGGYKVSGMGREHGTAAIREYTQLKSVTVGMERFKSRFEV
jgi:acyl-CoA reductase-like NAD-dependent aldehyde dehydrogenase